MHILTRKAIPLRCPDQQYCFDSCVKTADRLIVVFISVEIALGNCKCRRSYFMLNKNKGHSTRSGLDIDYDVWGKIPYQFLNSNGCTIDLSMRPDFCMQRLIPIIWIFCTCKYAVAGSFMYWLPLLCIFIMLTSHGSGKKSTMEILPIIWEHNIPSPIS